MNVCRKVAVLVLTIALGTGCANALRAIRGDLQSQVVSIVVENHSSEPREIYLRSARSGNLRLGRVYPLSRRVFHPPIDYFRNETILYSRPSNGTRGLVDDYVTTPFSLDSPRDVFWVITTGRRISPVDIR